MFVVMNSKLALSRRSLPKLRTIRITQGWDLRHLSTEHEDKKKSMFELEKESQNVFEAFAKTGPREFVNLHKLKLSYFTWERFENWLKIKERDFLIYNQQFIPQRHRILGNDLATAHFVVYRKGAVKFVGRPDWIRKSDKETICKQLPNKYTDGFHLEALDLSKTKICYEGLENMVNLRHLKFLSLRDCPQVDDWFLHRVSRLFGPTLEHLDLSGCTNISERALPCLATCSQLKTLVLKNITSNNVFELSCLLLEESNPNLTILGVKYVNVA